MPTRNLLKTVAHHAATALLPLLAALCYLAPPAHGASGRLALEFTGGSPASFPGYTLGWAFSLTTRAIVTSLGWYDDGADGLLSSHTVGIFTEAGALVTSVTVTSANPLNGNWRYAVIAPVALTPGNYVIAGTSGNDAMKIGCAGTTTLPGLSYTAGRYTPSTVLTFPTTPGDRGICYFGPNFAIADSGIHVFAGADENAPELVNAQPAMSFDNQQIDTTSEPKTFTILNDGATDLILSGIATDGANANDFTVATNGTSTTLSAGESTTFTVTFTPSGIGSRTAALHIGNSDPAHPSFTINLAGAGISHIPPGVPALEFTGGSSAPFPGYTLGWTFSVTTPVVVDSLGWYDEGGDGLRNSHTVGLFTAGGASLAIATVSSNDLLRAKFRYAQIARVTLNPGNYVIAGTSGTDEIQGTCTSSSIFPGVNYTGGIYVGGEGFSFPTTPGDRGICYFGPNFAIANSGIRVFAGADEYAPELVNAQPAMSFGNQPIDTTSQPKTFTILNDGATDLILSGIAKDGANANDFTVATNGTSTTLSAGESTTFTVTFTPSGIGLRTAALHIGNSDPAHPSFTINLAGAYVPAGQGASPVLEFSGGSPAVYFGYTLGWAFSVTTQAMVTSLGWYDDGADGFLDSHTVGIFTETGNLITSVTVTSADPLKGNWRYAVIDPVALTPGNYVIGGTSGNDAVRNICAGTTTLPGVSYTGGRYIPSAGLTFPTILGNQGICYFGPNFTIGENPIRIFAGTNQSAPELADGQATAVAFGSQATGTTSAARTFTIRNGGTADLILNGITKDGTNAGDFAIDTTGMSTTLAAGATTTVTVTVTPTGFGDETAAIHIGSNLTGPLNPFDIALAAYALDVTPPELLLPANIQLAATSPAGRVILYYATASDAGSGVASMSFLPVSGGTFPIGTTTVNASATDHAGNTTTGSFTVTVTASTTEEYWRYSNFETLENAGRAAEDADADGDGEDNRFERIVGSVPTDRNSRFDVRLEAVEGQPAQMAIIFSPRLADRIYALKFKARLSDPNWMPLPDFTISDDGLERTVTDLTAGDRLRFYHMEITVP